MSPRTADDRAERIASIVRMHAIAFDSPLFGMELRIRDDYEALLDFQLDPGREKLRKIASVIAAHRELFGSGTTAAERAVSEEADGLLRYLASLGRASEPERRRATILPRNLGLSFAKKGLGAPLFGPFRPPAAPTEPGIALLYRSVAADGQARLAAASLDHGTALRYEGLGAVVTSRARWLHCAIAPAGETPRLEPRGAFSAGPPTEHPFDHYTVYLAAAASRAPPRPATYRVDPYEFRYAYYFKRDATLRSRLGRYLGDLLTGTFCVPASEAATIARAFIDRLP